MPTDPMIGQVLNRSYRITRLIGRGAMAMVYEATNTRIALKRYAVKVLLPSAASIPDIHARFMREAEIAVKLEHPHIVEVIDFDETEDGKPYIVMELLEGENLAACIERNGRLSFAEVQQLAEQAASALQVAHDRGIVHRDMKPQNIFLLGSVGGPFRVKLLDFGISKIWDSQTVVTRVGVVLGTPQFMSPEQAAGRVDEIDQTTDTFALGAVCYLALAGILPFDAPSLRGVIHKVCSSAPAPLAGHIPAISPAVDRVLGRAMAKAKLERYQRIAEFAAELSAALRSKALGDELDISLQATVAAVPEEVTRELRGPAREESLPGPDRDAAPTLISGSHAAPLPDADATPTLISGSHAASPTGQSAIADSSLFHRYKRTNAAPGEDEATARTRRSRKTGLLLACTAVLLSAGGGWLVRQLNQAPPPAQHAAERRAAQVRIFLQLEPADARVYLDGEPQTTNPLVLAASPQKHRLVFLAKGYRLEERYFVARESMVLAVSLEKNPAAQEKPDIAQSAVSAVEKIEKIVKIEKKASSPKRSAAGPRAKPARRRPPRQQLKLDHDKPQLKTTPRSTPQPKLEIDEGDDAL